MTQKRQTIYGGRLERIEQSLAHDEQFATVSDQLTTRDEGTLKMVFDMALQVTALEAVDRRIRILAARLGVRLEEGK